MNLYVKLLEEIKTTYGTSENINVLNYIKFVGDYNKKGCYLIDKHYVGRTNESFLERFSGHLMELRYWFTLSNNSYNKFKLFEMSNNLLKNKKIVVRIISNNPEDEKKLIDKYSQRYQLTNLDVNRKNFRSLKTYQLSGNALCEDVKQRLGIENPNKATIDLSKENLNLRNYIKTLKNDMQYLRGEYQYMKHENAHLLKKIEVYKEEIQLLKDGVNEMDHCLVLG